MTAGSQTIALIGARRLERLILTAERSRHALLHGLWIFLLLTWCVAWPITRWVAARHAAITEIEPQVVRVETLDPEAAPPEFMQLLGVPRLRHSIELTKKSNAVRHLYVPLTASTRESEPVRVVVFGLSPYLLDPKAPAPLKPPFPVQLDPAGLPTAIRSEMARRGAHFAEKVYLVRSIELLGGRVQNKHAATDRLIASGVKTVGSSLSVACFIGWLVCVFRLKRLRAMAPAPARP